MLALSLFGSLSWNSGYAAQDPAVTGFSFAIREERASYSEVMDPRIVLEVQTNEALPCWRIPVDVEVISSGRTINLTVHDPVPPPSGTGCAAVLSSAASYLPLDLALGRYELFFKWRDSVDIYDLAVTDRYTELTARNAAFTTLTVYQTPGIRTPPWENAMPDHARWYRFPQDSFILTCGSVTGDEEFCARFKQRIESLDITPIEITSDGIWPFPTQPNGNYYNLPTFLYSYRSQNDWETAKAEVAEYIKDILSTCGRTAAVENWRHDFAYSWLVKDTGCEYLYSGTPSPEPAVNAIPSSTLAGTDSPVEADAPSDSGDNLGWLFAGIGGFAVALALISIFVQRRSAGHGQRPE